MPEPQSSPKTDHEKGFHIFVNGRPREVTDHRMTYEAVVELAFPGPNDPNTVVFTVTYANPHGHDGTLVAGQSVEVKEGMSFVVSKTNRS